MITRAVAVLIVALMVQTQAGRPSLADWNWLDIARKLAFTQLRPLTDRTGQLVAYRSHRDLDQDVPERYLRVERGARSASGDEVFVATTVTPTGQSIQRQLLDFHRSQPEVSVDAALGDVRVRRITVTSTQCAELMASVDALSGLTITIPDREEAASELAGCVSVGATAWGRRRA